MCTLAAYVGTFRGFPLIVAANRDEFLDRPSERPRLRDGPPRMLCGLDSVHGGTWLGVNEHGLLAALLNRRSTTPADPQARSRGLLCLDALHQESLEAARDLACREDPEAYNPFNLLVADADSAWIVTNHGGRTEETPLPRGLHLLTNLALNDPTCPRIAASYRLFADLLEPGSPKPLEAPFVESMRRVLSTHETPLDPRDAAAGNSLCVHAGPYGTRSSTIVALDASGTWTFLDADDAPCRGNYRRLAEAERIRYGNAHA